MEPTIKLKCIYDQKISFALQQNRVPVFKSLIVQNLTEEKLSNLKITISANPNFTEKLELNINELEGLETINLNPTLNLSANYLGSLEEKMTGFIHIKVLSGEKLLYEERLPIDVLSYDTWPGSSVLPEIISSFITPNRPFISELIKQASSILEKETGSSSMTGYQTGDPNEVLRQLSAIYSAIQSSGISYSNPPASFEMTGQKIRLPDTIATHRIGTCLDTTLLFSACAEAVGINSLVVFFDGHALPGFWLKDYCSPESYQDDKSIITKHMATGINELIVVESTGLTEKSFTFTQAIKSAQVSIYKEYYFRFFVDVGRSRIGQITPLPIRSMQGLSQQILDTSVNPEIRDSSFTIENVEIIPENSEDSFELDRAKNKINYWQTRLLDLSLRNNLLNFRSTTQGIPLVTSDIGLLEDLLAMGEKISILHRPSEWGANVRSFDDRKDLIVSKLLTDDMRNNRIRSLLTEGELEKRLVTLYRRAKNTMEENGANSLFIAIGFLKWFETKAHIQERYAPILLLPVELVRLSAKRGYYIRVRDEEIQINISLIEHLKQKFGIDATRLYDIPKDDHGADVNRVLTTMRRLIMGMERWDVVEETSIGIFSFSKFVMWYDLVHRTEDLKKNKVVRSLMEGHCTWEVDEAMYAPLTAEKDETQEMLTPLSYDSTQMEAILAASTDNSFVLHGPPGSGKSQTIANMISHALGTGKTVLFVAEKMAALSVVHKRLSDLGIDPFCLEVYSNKAQKRDILQQLEVSFDIQSKTKDTSWQQVSKEIIELKKELNSYTRALHSKTSLGQSVFEMIETYTNVNNHHSISFDRNKVNEMSELEFKRNQQNVRELRIAGKDCGDFAKNPWMGIKRKTYSLELQDLISHQLAVIQNESMELNEKERELSSLIGLIKTVKNFTYFSSLDRVGSLLMNIPQVNLELLAHKGFKQFKEDAKKVIEIGGLRDELRTKLLSTFDSNVVNLDIEKLLVELRATENSWFLKKIMGRNKVVKELKGYLHTGKKLDSNALQQILNEIKNFKQLQLQLKEFEEPMKVYLNELWSDSEGNWEEIDKAVLWIEKLRTIVEGLAESTGDIESVSYQLESLTNSNQSLLQKGIEEYKTVFIKIQEAWESIIRELESAEIHEPENNDWAINSYNKSAKLIAGLGLLKNMCNFTRVVQEVESQGLENVTKPYKQGEILTNELEDAYLFGFYRVRIDHEVSNDKVLSTFTTTSFEEKIKKFIDLDDELSDLTKLEVYVRLMENAPNLMTQASINSEPGILIKAIKSKGRGISMRQLFERIPNLLQKIKPCMLMSPLSVAQYLDPKFPQFDLVIFDEASQMPTSEAIGAMARGKNVVVVGDPKQLPPTSFFKSQQVEEDDFDTQDLESVLDDCLSIHMPQKHLRWHYRSEHESLISFSNNHYYENKLITIPSVDDRLSRVTFKQVNGIYDRGKTRHNLIEAKAVVEEIFNRLSNPSQQNESIGVVTFSQVQQTLIEDLIDERLKKNSSFEKYFSDQVAEPVFVKNLENVQGDERDLILFSVGYGPDATGHMTLNFGPLNREGGWRRLNVAVSRAKKEMILFASMDPDTIDLSRTNSEGLKGLRAFMEFAKKGNEPLLFENRQNQGKSNSEVIVEKISRFLESNGYQIEKNLGSSEFKIDIAVINKEDERAYIAAIQLDGHNYGEVVTPRDREKLRNVLLNRLGWNIINVWTVEWWHNEQKQLDKILKLLIGIKNMPVKSKKPSERIQEKNRESIQDKIKNLIIEEVDDGNNERFQYIPAKLDSVNLPNEYFYSYEGLAVIKKQIGSIVESEAPVSQSQMIRRIIGAWGFARSGAKIEQVVEKALNQLDVYKTNEEKGKFVWKSKNQMDSFTIFRFPDEYRRPLADISREEYANGIKEILSYSFQLPKEDLIREISKQAGYSRSGKIAGEFVQEGIELLTAAGTVEEKEDGNLVYKG